MFYNYAYLNLEQKAPSKIKVIQATKSIANIQLRNWANVTRILFSNYNLAWLSYSFRPLCSLNSSHLLL